MKNLRSVTARLVAVLAASLALAGCVTNDAAQSERPAILPIDSLADDAEGIQKWVRPIRVALAGEGAEKQRAQVTARLSALRNVTGHRLSMAEDAEGDVWLVFGADTADAALARHAKVFAPLYSDEAAMRADLEDDGENELCRAKRGMSAENRYEIVYAAGRVPTGLSSEVSKNCINRLLITALGSAGTKPVAEEQPAKPESQRKLAAALEIILLKVWYDDRVKPGMTAAQVQPIMNQAMKDLLKKQ